MLNIESTEAIDSSYMDEEETISTMWWVEDTYG